MTTYCIRFFLLGYALLIVQYLKSQDKVIGYWEPEVALNYKVGSNYAHNFSMDMRQYTYEDSDLGLRARHLDLSHFSKFTVGSQQSLALGIMYRFRDTFETDAQNELRLTQQYNVTHKIGNVRLGNRLRTEQRITVRTIHRFRYRLAVDLPLKGEKLDVGEPYFVASTESLLSTAMGIGPEWDQRIISHIGWRLNPTTRFQTGVEYRAENYAQKVENVLFLLTSLIFSL
ncbi:MAG: DUF2490 domain-containing protein [Bacteroidota bacterium]